MAELFRWSIGDQNTSTRCAMSDRQQSNFLRMAKLSVYSFQKFFDGDFVIGFNGSDISRFKENWNETQPELEKKVSIFNSRDYPNPYPTFFPLSGVWWKWVPFRYDSSKAEISVDTDIICISSPESWYKWLKNDIPLLIPLEAISEVCEATCGDVWDHIVLKDKRALNCGIIGQKNIDLTERFFKLTELVDYGTYNGNFVTEQGLFNILFYSLQNEGIEHFPLPYEQNCQAKHLHLFLTTGDKKIETVHFTARTKLIFNDLYTTFKGRVDNRVSDTELLSLLTDWYVLNKENT